MTKEELIKENGKLYGQVERLQLDDKTRRIELSGLLDNYEWEIEREYGYSSSKKTKKVIDASWLEIAFLIGELKADADYAMCIQAREDLKKENADLRERIKQLEFPDTPTSLP